MDTKKLLWLMALVFSVAILVQYLELPYGYLLSSLLALGKTQVTSMSSDMMSTGFSNDTAHLIQPMAVINSVNATKLSPPKNVLNTTVLSDAKNTQGKHDMKLEFSRPSNFTVGGRNESLALVETRKDGLDLPVSGGSLSRSSKMDSYERNSTLSASSTLSSSVHTGKNLSLSIQSLNSHTTSTGHDLSMLADNSSNARTSASKPRLKGPPSVVVPISSMNEMLHQSRLSCRKFKPQWHSPVDQELLHARKSIENAQNLENKPHDDVAVYRNYSRFVRSYELMEKAFKIYVYTEGERPVFHNPQLRGIYASEGWFMKQLEENKHFITKNASKAHLFYLPFSSQRLQETLYVPDSHSRKNLVQYLSSYLQNITTIHRFWNRSGGADHFLVACHDWAPAETSRIMRNCIRSLCNADAQGGFQFGKDVSLPETYIRDPQNPLANLGGKPPSERKILAFFAGQMHGYLRPILLKHWENKDPDMKISGKLANNRKGQTTYAQYMKSSKYCISARGYEAYTPRVVEAIIYECVPVIISDNYVPPFFETLNWDSFAVFVLEKDIPNLKKILLSIPEEKYLEMQNRVRLVQKHFLWHRTNTPVRYDVFHMILHSLWDTRVFQLRPA